MYAVDDEITPVYPERKKKVLFDDRLDRQLRIQGWDQAALDGAKIGVVGDDDLLASLYIMSASALGINNISVIAPVLNETLLETAKRVNPRLNLMFMEGFYTHPVMDDVFNGCSLIVDLSHYGLKKVTEKTYLSLEVSATKRMTNKDSKYSLIEKDANGKNSSTLSQQIIYPTAILMMEYLTSLLPESCWRKQRVF
jgi:hypothetical protein